LYHRKRLQQFQLLGEWILINKDKENKNFLKYKKSNKWVVIVRNLNALKCIVNALIFKYFAMKIVIV